MNIFQEMSASELADALLGLADGQDDDMGLMLREAADRFSRLHSTLQARIQREPRHRVSLLVNDWEAIVRAANVR